MRLERSSFTKHYLEVEIEGFEIHEFISLCIKNNIALKEIKYLNNIKIRARIRSTELKPIKALGRNKYQITVVSEGGYEPWINDLFKDKVAIIGIVIFVLVVYFQSLFISEIRISGYEKITENEIRRCLEEVDFKEGAMKTQDLEKVKLHLYSKLDNLVHVAIYMDGCLARVEVVEGHEDSSKDADENNQKNIEENQPCHVVAEKEGYIYEIIPIEGVRNVSDGVFVRKGDVLISGIVPINSTAYGLPESEITERFVHAEGTALAKIPERIVINQEATRIKKEETGNWFYSLCVQVGDREFDLKKCLMPYEVCQVEDEYGIEGNRPFPYSFSVEKVKEIKLLSEKKTHEDIEKEVDKYLRQKMKEKSQEKVQILNKSLYFSQEKNIIEVTVMLETLQEIGVEQEIVFGEQINEHEEASNQ